MCQRKPSGNMPAGQSTSTVYSWGDSIASNNASTIGMEIITLEVTISRPAMWSRLIRITGVFMICMEMWEWVSDWYGEYATGHLTDPSELTMSERGNAFREHGGTLGFI